MNKTPWEPEEELMFIDKHKIYGNKWAEIGKFLNGRNDNAVKNYYYSTVRKVMRKISLKKLTYDLKDNDVERELINMVISGTTDCNQFNDYGMQQVMQPIVQNNMQYSMQNNMQYSMQNNMQNNMQDMDYNQNAFMQVPQVSAHQRSNS